MWISRSRGVRDHQNARSACESNPEETLHAVRSTRRGKGSGMPASVGDMGVHAYCNPGSGAHKRQPRLEPLTKMASAAAGCEGRGRRSRCKMGLTVDFSHAISPFCTCGLGGRGPGVRRRRSRSGRAALHEGRRNDHRETKRLPHGTGLITTPQRGRRDAAPGNRASP